MEPLKSVKGQSRRMEFRDLVKKPSSCDLQDLKLADQTDLKILIEPIAIIQLGKNKNSHSCLLKISGDERQNLFKTFQHPEGRGDD
ncbi:hypothetical protein NDU88_001562 [Pleurodeles waltl]|uniref:Uncharacterized protein n=1 Tax=Pleurodeles waltl TaxID=8319 RepID=A0AAV7LD59_PLEWA|nr:hypothetical protein NDU88_001562 [Pleurodeles waltl]